MIVPPTLRSLLLYKLHDTHPGINRMKSLARSYVWWPGINKEIESMVARCQICQENHSAPPQTVTHPWECPKFPWIRVHVDHAGPFMNHYFLKTTVQTLRQIFSIHGLTEQLVSDNSPAFTSHEFKEFIQNNGIRHSLTVPYHP